MFIGDAVRSGVGELFFLIAVIRLQLGIQFTTDSCVGWEYIFFLLVRRSREVP